MKQMDAFLIAPCGMNCGLCMAYQRDKNHCPGCRGDDAIKQVSCLNCIIKNCDKRMRELGGTDEVARTEREAKHDFCFVCDTFPCARLKALDKRYRTKYGMSMLENLEYIRERGVDAFVAQEKTRRKTCAVCGNYLSVHRENCMMCGK